MSQSNPRAYQWHHKPNGCDKRCSLCGYPSYLRGEHRAVRPDEGSNARWIRVRRKDDGSFVHIEVGAPRKLKPRAPTGPTKKTLQAISRAAAMLADGKTMRAVAAELKITEQSLYEFKAKYPEIWRSAVDRAMSAMAAVIEAQAGTIEVLADPAAHVAKAMAAEKWAQSNGREFMPVKADTLRAFYRSYYRPMCMAELCAQEVETFERVIRLWVITTGDPPLLSIRNETLATFRECVAKLPGRQGIAFAAPSTVHAYMVHLQRILDKAGPPGRGNRDAAGILKTVPWAKPPRIDLRVPKTVSLEVLSQFYDSLVAAEKPHGFGFRAAAWWRALIVVTYNTGLRRRTLFGLKMSDIDWGRSRLLIRPDNNKSKKRYWIPLNGTALAHLRGIRSDREMAYPWPHCIRYFHTYFHRLQDAAGIPRADHFGLHSLRRSLATALYEQGNPTAARLTLGHGSFATTETHYVDPSGTISQALDALPQPAAFRAAESVGSA